MRVTWMFGVGVVCLAALLATGRARAQEAAGDPRGIAVEAINPMPAFSVRVDVDHPDRVYREGDVLVARVRSQEAGYLYLFYCDANKKVSCIFPNEIQNDNRIPANAAIEVPDRKSEFRFRIQAPFGREVLKAVVSTRPLKELELANLTKADVTPIGEKEFKAIFASRGIIVERVRSEHKPRQPYNPEFKDKYREWAEHYVEITTLAKAGAGPQRQGLDGKPRPGRDGKWRVGVFIGISQYQDGKIRKLKVAHKDAEQMAEVMKSAGKLDDALVLTDEKATLKAVEEAIRIRLPAATRPGDEVILFWSGHGGRTANVDKTEPDGFDEYLVPHDGKLGMADTIRGTMLMDKTFGRWVQALDGRKLVVILDACHSGGHAAGAAKSLSGAADKEGDVPFKHFLQTTLQHLKDIGQKDAAVLASSKASEPSFERRAGDLSVMTWFLVEQLRSADDKVSLKGAFKHLREKVPTFVEKEFPGATQTPVLMDNITPPFFLRP